MFGESLGESEQGGPDLAQKAPSGSRPQRAGLHGGAAWGTGEPGGKAFQESQVHEIQQALQGRLAGDGGRWRGFSDWSGRDSQGTESL